MKKINEKAQKVIAFLKENKGKQFTLAEISQALGEKIASGTITAIIATEANPDAPVKHGEVRLVPVVTKREVNTYCINDTEATEGETEEAEEADESSAS